ncbi:arrestin domain-containing protein 3-like [Drosophila eugracilis]|uniref:arrestin domain-containing protein 3-like n=1 Tax=Drosophila eugracilis TaxID=29029 RepID=UPI001BDABDDD|nr:arrestin domain-containing protein 3-like [Drosophila eugracilis]
MRCSFEFDRSDPVYYSGETISGCVNLTTKKEYIVNEIFIIFEGQGKVRWQDQRELSLTGQEIFRGTQTYLDTRINVLGSGTLPVGTHTYPFSITLPVDCPSSIVMEFGKIWYEIKVCIDHQEPKHKVFKKPLTVLQMYNLNMSPQLLIPLVHEDYKHFCCWHCRSGPVLSTLTIPFGGYAPGQNIRFILEVDNKSSSRDLVGMYMQLKQTYKLQAQNPEYLAVEKGHILAQNYQKAKVLRLSKKTIEGSLAIPAVPPTSLNDGILSVSYEVLLNIDLNDCQTDPDLYVPIVIGTIPLARSAEHSTSAADMIPQKPDTSSEDSADLPPSYDNYRPPTFEEALIIGKHFVDIDVGKEDRSDDFIPRYPMYTNFGTASAPT